MILLFSSWWIFSKMYFEGSGPKQQVEILYFTSIGKGSTNSMAILIFKVKTIKGCEESEEELHYTSNQDMEKEQEKIMEIRTKC